MANYINKGLQYSVIADTAGNPLSSIPVTGVSDPAAQGAFGAALVVSEISQCSMKFTTGMIHEDLYETNIAGMLSQVTVDDSRCKLQNDTGVGDYAMIRTRKSAQYKPGQGHTTMFAGSFDNTAPVNSIQLFGSGNAACGLYFGYDGETFGVLRQTDGKAEIQGLEVLLASSAFDSVDIELDGVTYNVLVDDAMGDTGYTAYQIVNNYSWADEGWNATVRGSTVYFEKRAVGPATGAFSFSPGPTGADASFTQYQAGQADVKNWTPQASWNGEDILDGSGASGVTLDPGLNNVYKISSQWLGGGAIRYFVENPATGRFILVHTDLYPNTSQAVSIIEPDVYLQFTVASLGSTTALTAYVNSAVITREGDGAASQLVKYSVSNSVAGVSTTETAILSIRNSFVNQVPAPSFGALIPTTLSVASDGKTVAIRVRKNEYLGDGMTADYPIWEYVDYNSGADKDTNSRMIAQNGTVLFTVIVASGNSQVVKLRDILPELNQGESYTITAQVTTSSTSDVDVAICFDEEQ